MQYKNFLILIFAVLSVSTSGLWIRSADAHFLAIAFYRLILAFLCFLPFLILKLQKEYKQAHNPPKGESGKLLKQIPLNALAGIVFGFHLILWISAVQNTSIANAALCFSINPLSTALIEKFYGRESISLSLIISIALGLFGVFAIGYGDFNLQMDQMHGDILALLSGFTFSIYLLIGKVMRKRTADHESIDINVYMCVLFFFAAITCGLIGLSQNVKFIGFENKTWLMFAGLTIFPSILGHGLFNYLVKNVKASIISTATLGEPLFAGIGAYYIYSEKITYNIFIGFIFIILSIILLMNSFRRGAK